MNLRSEIDSHLHNDIHKLIKETTEKQIEAAHVRANDDKWRPMNLNNGDGVKHVNDDMNDVGIVNISNYIYGKSLHVRGKSPKPTQNCRPQNAVLS